MKSAKGKQWREAFSKARTLSQASLDKSPASSPSPGQSWHRKSSILDEQTTEKELEDYLEGLKMKSGIRSLWHGNTFSKTVRKNSLTPDISVSSVETDEHDELYSDKGESDGDDDFKPNVMAFSMSENTNDNTDSSVSPLRGVQLDLGGLSQDENSTKEVILNNNQSEKSISERKSIQSITNNLSKELNNDTEDEVTEDIYEDVASQSVDYSNSTTSIRELHTQNTHSKTQSKGIHTSSADESSSSHKNIDEGLSRKSNSGRSSKAKNKSSKETVNSKHSSSSLHSVKKKMNKQKQEKMEKRQNRITHEMSVQTEPVEHLPSGIGVGMATQGPHYGGTFLDPSPIATHVVNADTLEAVTAYNPAVIALTDMLRQQLRLVEQFVNNSQRIYRSYSESLSPTCNYTTLQHTLQYIENHRPQPLTMEQALNEVQEELS